MYISNYQIPNFGIDMSNNLSYIAGNLGIGTQNPQYTVDISGSLRTAGYSYSTYFVTTSDYRIKENPQTLDSTYTVDRLHPVSYINKLIGKKDLGFLAHELQQEFPYLVEGDKDGEQTQSINYNGIIALLVKEIQELKKRVVILENK
jgi:hypothetical protein